MALSVQPCLDLPQGVQPVLRQFSETRIKHGSSRHNDNVHRRPASISRYRSMRIPPEQLPQQSFRSVPPDCSSDPALCDTEPKPVTLASVGAIINDKVDRVDFPAGAVDSLEITLSSDSLRGHEREPSRSALGCARSQAVRRFLPLRRRRLITARPPLVFIRVRKPCVFFRRRLFG